MYLATHKNNEKESLASQGQYITGLSSFPRGVMPPPSSSSYFYQQKYLNPYGQGPNPSSYPTPKPLPMRPPSPSLQYSSFYETERTKNPYYNTANYNNKEKFRFQKNDSSSPKYNTSLSTTNLYNLYNPSPENKNPTGDVQNLINSPLKVSESLSSERELETEQDFCLSRDNGGVIYDIYARPSNQNSVNWGDCAGANPMVAIDRDRYVQRMEFEYPDKYILTAPYGLLL